jgi:hypothetical protein
MTHCDAFPGYRHSRANPGPPGWLQAAFCHQYARARPRASWGLEMKTDNDWIERLIAAEHDERARMRRASKAARGAQWQAIKVARGRASEERARLRELRNKPCGARTRTGQTCQRKGVGKGGRCPNHGGMSTGPKTPEGRARLAALLKARWTLSRASGLQEVKSKVEKNRNERVAARTATAKHGGR